MTNMERSEATFIGDKGFTLVGPELKVGDQAPEFQGIDNSFHTVTLASTGNGVRIFSVVVSLDTPVCDAQTSRFNQEVTKHPDLSVYSMSMDLPYAQRRWCDAFGVDHIKMVSDHQSGSFGANYGVLIKELRIHSRALFVVDQHNVIQYAEYVREMGDQPNYDAALAIALKLGKV